MDGDDRVFGKRDSTKFRSKVGLKSGGKKKTPLTSITMKYLPPFLEGKIQSDGGNARDTEEGSTMPKRRCTTERGGHVSKAASLITRVDNGSLVRSKIERGDPGLRPLWPHPFFSFSISSELRRHGRAGRTTLECSRI